MPTEPQQTLDLESIQISADQLAPLLAGVARLLESGEAVVRTSSVNHLLSVTLPDLSVPLRSLSYV